MSHTTVSPAYGREYKSAKAAKADWEAGKDFTVQDMSSRWDGKPINKEDAKTAGFSEVNIRFAQMTKLVVVKL